MAEAEETRTPGYLHLLRTGELDERAERAHEMLRDCVVCPQECHVNRIEGEEGFCRTGLLPRVSSYSPHFGEEAPLVGRYGSGTIFFAGCNMRCEFCQNLLELVYEIQPIGGYRVGVWVAKTLMPHPLR